MAQEIRGTLIGRADGLSFDVQWPEEDPDGLGWGSLLLRIDGRKVWTQGDDEPGPVSWTWIDLVEHLASSWPFLEYEEIGPYGLAPVAANGLFEPRALQQARKVHGIERVDDAVYAFRHRHDLAAGLQGIHLPSVWMLREGRLLRILAGDAIAEEPLEQGLATLENLVEAVVQRLGHDPHPRSVVARERWRDRHLPTEKALAIRSGASLDQLRAWTPPQASFASFWGEPGEAVERVPLAAARLSGAMSSATRSVILSEISGIPKTSTPGLDDLVPAAEAVVEGLASTPPHEQGYRLARWLRSVLSAERGRVDPGALLDGWGVILRDLPALEEQLDAVACWGPGHGPAVLVNPNGRFSNSPRGRRATLAHEVAHLLVDRRRHLPAAEVLGGATPTHLEQRARAFAAELLLPRSEAAQIIADSSNLDRASRRARQDYGVSLQVFGWQIRNGAGWHLLDRVEQRRVRRWCSRIYRSRRRTVHRTG